MVMHYIILQVIAMQCVALSYQNFMLDLVVLIALKDWFLNQGIDQFGGMGD
jgi:hypothetical protein